MITYYKNYIMPATVKGIQIARVLQLESDPIGENRIFINIPSLAKNKNVGVWAKVARLDAGNNRGTFFLPEINDDVIVGFINDDASNPVVLGMLNSAAKPAPVQAKNSNPEKGIITRAKMRIYFNDNEKQISIDTPAGNSILLDENLKEIRITDQNNNKIIMDTSGIHLESSQNINIRAGGTISIDGASSKISAKGSAEIKAGGQISIESDSIKLSSAAATEISGAVVKLN
jgi:uncharacterized protein involved in type VI secretion and phage assembly